MPFGGYGQATSDSSLASNILSFLPTQEQQTAQVNPSSTGMLPTVNPQYTTFTSPTAPTVNAGSFGGNLTGYNAAVQGAEQGLTSSENSTYGQAMSQYEKNMAQFGNLTGVYQTLANTYNLPGYEQDINSLQGLLQNLNQDVNSQTTLGGGLMTQSARDEVYSNEQNPLQLALSNASREYETGQTNVNNLLGTYEQSLTNELKPEELNISNLPTLFGQTNEAAQAGYSQGQEAIQSTIADQLQREQVAAEQEQAAAAVKQADVLAGAGGNAASALLGGSPGQTSNAATYGLKVQGKPQSGYYFEDSSGKPINAIQYAQATGAQPLAVVTAMANSGDSGAKQLIDELNLMQTQSGIDPATALTQYYGSF
jgi:hypothetical protein